MDEGMRGGVGFEERGRVDEMIWGIDETWKVERYEGV